MRARTTNLARERRLTREGAVPVLIAIQNRSADVNDDQARIMARACELQIRDHVAPAYDRRPAEVRFFAEGEKVPDGCPLIIIFERDNDAVGLVPADDIAYAKATSLECTRVFVEPVREQEGGILDGDPSVSSVVSHEALERFIDPWIDQWVSTPDGRAAYALEAADPVEEQAYEILVPGEPATGEEEVAATAVMVSNFVFPAWFRERTPRGKVDHMGELSRSLELSRDGYIVKFVAATDQALDQLQLQGNPAGWREQTKQSKLARTSWRLIHGPGS
jgi:hypothetical protein